MAQKGKLYFETDRCKGCSLCIEACPVDVLGLADEVNVKGYLPAVAKHEEKCIACQSCAIMCPDVVIKVERL